MSPTLAQRYAGTMLGVLAGDALGAAYENKEPSFIAEDLERRGGLVPFDYDDPWEVRGRVAAGSPTDDSELTAALAESIIERGGSDPYHQYRFFKRAVNGSRTFVGYGASGSFGRTTRLMLKAASYERALEREDRPIVPSNGSLMRCAPLALWHYSRHPEIRDATVRASSAVTHLHETAIETTVLCCFLLDRLLHGASPSEAWAEAGVRGSRNESVNALLVTPLPEPEATNVWLHKGGKAGSAAHTLHIASWSLLHAADFRDGIERAVRYAGDTDTQAAVAGALLGARFGVDAIPAEWQESLDGRDRMLELADMLLRA